MAKYLVLGLFVSLGVYAEAKVLEPYTESFKFEFSPEQRSKFENGELVFNETKEDLPGKKFYREGIAGFRVNAKPEAIWEVIQDFSKYPDWAYKVGGTKEYKPAEGTKHFVEFKAQIVGDKYYTISDAGKKDKGFVFFQTDKEKKSECVEDTAGMWHVEPVKNHPDQSNVYFAGKVVLSRKCAKGFLGIGGFNGQDMAKQTCNEIRKRTSKK